MKVLVIIGIIVGLSLILLGLALAKSAGKKKPPMMLLLSIIVLTMASCESPSALRAEQLRNESPIKVVIIDSGKSISASNMISYKIKRIDNRTVGYITSINLYESNDTILAKPSTVKY